MPEDWVAVGSAVSGRRHELGTTQKTLSKRSGVSVPAIREIERPKKGRRHVARTLTALSEALGWPPQYLDDVLNGREPQEAAPETELQAVRDMLRQCLEKISVLEQQLAKIDVLEHRLDVISDIVYRIDSRFDVIIERGHFGGHFGQDR